MEVALLDRRGVILAVNQAWQDFCVDNDGDPARTGVGMNYLAICDAAPQDPHTQRVRQLVESALRGEMAVATSLQFPCHSPAERRWFDLQVSSRYDDHGACRGATVTVSAVLGAPSNALEADVRLTPREQRVLGLVADGLTNRQIGDQLGIAEKTAKNHVASILAKMGFSRRVHAAVYAATARDPRAGASSR
jgi:DNA-binding NarL/FixJ family response regulator